MKNTSKFICKLVNWRKSFGVLVERCFIHDDVIKWKHFPCYWPFVRGIHRSPVKSPHKGQRRGAFMFPLICVWINGCVNNREAGGLRRYRTHYEVSVMIHRSMKVNLHCNSRWLFCYQITNRISCLQINIFVAHPVPSHYKCSAIGGWAARNLPECTTEHEFSQKKEKLHGDEVNGILNLGQHWFR